MAVLRRSHLKPEELKSFNRGDSAMRTKMVIVWSACGFMLLAGRALWAAAVDLGRPFEVDKDTVALYHLDDVASGEVKDAVAAESRERWWRPRRPTGNSARP